MYVKFPFEYICRQFYFFIIECDWNDIFLEYRAHSQSAVDCSCIQIPETMAIKLRQKSTEQLQGKM